MREDKIFLNENNTLVSTTRIIIKGTTYATSNVTSVACGVIKPKRGCAMLMVMLGGLALIGAQSNTTDTVVLNISLGILGIGILWFIVLRPKYTVLLTSSSGQLQVLKSKKKDWILQIIAAINEAIIARG